MEFTVNEVSLDSLDGYWANSSYNLNWNVPFVLPAWLKVWWKQLGNGAELYLRAVNQGNTAIGLAPLLVQQGIATFIGNSDVCDYIDFVIATNREYDFFTALLDYLPRQGIGCLDLRPVRPDSTVLTHLVTIADKHGHQVNCIPEDVTLELDLPDDWDQYLATLSAKQRHEVRRKLRRLEEEGTTSYLTITDSASISHLMDTFLKMFAQSRPDKAAFLTFEKESFFRAMATSLAEAGILHMGTLHLNDLPVAMTICFDYHDCRYLYNSGYDPSYKSLSVGVLCKVLDIKDSIEQGISRFDFLKGRERYKYHLGGSEIPLYSCQIEFK